jgi:hypothetical protein
MEHKKDNGKKKQSGRDLQSVRASIGSLAHELWLEKRNTFNPAEVEWLVDGRLMQQLGELSKSELSRVERLLKRTVPHGERRYMTGSPI